MINNKALISALGFTSLVLVSLFAAGEDTTPPPTLPAGSTLHVRTTVTISTRTNQSGDPWTGKVVEPVFANGQEVVPAGSLVEGRVAFVKPPGRAKGVGELRLVLDTISTTEGPQFVVSAGLEDAEGTGDSKVKGQEGTIQGPGKSKKGTAVETGVDAGVGAGVGAIAAGGSGALYGAGIGAAAGIIHNVLKRHKDVIVPQGTELTFVISRNTTGKTARPRP